MKPAVYSCLIAALAVGPVGANPPCTSNHCAAPVVVHHQAAVVAPVAAIIQPLYGASYTGAGGADDETKELLRSLIAEVKAMRADLAASQPVRPLASPKVDAFAVVRANCVSCHSGANAKKGFRLTDKDGKLRELSGPDIRAVLNSLDGKGGYVQMPPAGSKPLTEPEKAALKAALSDGPPKAVEPIPPGKK